MPARLVRILACLPLLASLSCGRGDEPPYLLFSNDVQSLENPFPDLRLLGAGGYRSRPEWYRPFLMPAALRPRMVSILDRWAEGISEVRGLGNFGQTLLRVSEGVDLASLEGKAARLRRVGEGRYEVLEESVVIEHSFSVLDGTGREVTSDFPEFLFVRPSAVLPDGEVGLLVIKRGLKTRGGVELGRGFEFEDAQGSEERIAAAAEALGVAEDEILLVLPQRSDDALEVVRSWRDWTASTAQPPGHSIPAQALLNEEGGQIPVGVYRPSDTERWAQLRPLFEKFSFSRPSTAVGILAQGTFKSRELRVDGVMPEGHVADPASAPEHDLRFLLTLPAGEKPAGGYRIVIGTHGLNGRNTVRLGGEPTSFCAEVAEVLARRGLGCLGIDAPSHGSRGSSFDFFAIDDVRKIRDNFRQATFDLLQLTRVAHTLDVDGDGAGDVDPELGLFGNSLGALMAGSLVSLDSRVHHAVLNVGGGGLSNILSAVDVQDKVGLLMVAEAGLEFTSAAYYGMFPLIRATSQLVLESADPVVHAQALRGSQVPVLLQEGLGDLTIPNFTTTDFARSAGLEATNASATGSAIRAWVQTDPARFLPADRLEGYNGHGIFWDIEPARTQALVFLESRGTQLIVE